MFFRDLGTTGLKVSVIGFGASPLGNVFEEVSTSSVDGAVGLAIDRGINLFDVSPYYGDTVAETRLGQALRGKRDSIYLATKCGRYGAESFDFSAQRVRSSLEQSLKRLQTDSVDILQAHDVEFGEFEQIVHETIPAMEELKREGKVRAVGVTAYWPGYLARVLKQTPVDCVLNYCHSNLFIDDMQVELVPAARERRVGLLNASPLHMGLLGDKPLPSWHPAPQAVREAAAKIREICGSFGVEAPTLGLAVCLRDPEVASTFVGFSSAAEVRAACDALEFDPPAEMMAEVRGVLAPVLNTVWPQGRPENEDMYSREAGESTLNGGNE